MGYVITIERRAESPLNGDEMTAALAADGEFVPVEGSTWKWQAAPGNSDLWINVGESSLWTDGGRGWTSESALAKLQRLASGLHADVVGEEGELLSDVASPASLPTPASAAAAAGGGLIALVFLPVVILIALIRLPWILWQIARKK